LTRKAKVTVSLGTVRVIESKVELKSAGALATGPSQ
jgi:hypothetical protein